MLEVLQILEGEVNLRENTRVAEQARPALDWPRITSCRPTSFRARRRAWIERVDKLAEAIKKLPDGESEFGYEIGLLGKVSR